jgi:apolipoprotein N-acyltransferase
VTFDPGRYRPVLVLLAGALAVSAFAPFGAYPVVMLALAYLFHVWRADSPRRALRHGFLFGLGYFGAGVSWVYVSIHHYGQVPAAVALLVAAGLVAFLSLYPALLGYGLKRMYANPGWAGTVFVYPAGWTLSEWLRGWVFTGFPWLTIGSSQTDSPLAGLAPVSGVYGTGFAVAVSAGLLLAVLEKRRRLASLLVLGALWGAAALLGRVEWTQPRGEPLAVALVQGNIAQEQKWRSENLISTLARYTELTLALPDTDLVVWPETAIPAFYDQVEETFIPHLETELRARDMALLTGIPVLEHSSWDYYNAVIAINGARAFYYKQHLVPYGEYLPLRGLIGHTLDALAVPNADFSRGPPAQALLEAAGYPVATSICYEVVFGDQLIRDLPAAALLVNVSNDAWFGRSLAPHQHLQMARLRARETGRPMLRATNTGISAIIDYRGRITARGPQDEEAVITGTVVPRQGPTPYVLMGDSPVVILSVIILLLPWVAGRGQSERDFPQSRRGAGKEAATSTTDDPENRRVGGTAGWAERRLG